MLPCWTEFARSPVLFWSCVRSCSSRRFSSSIWSVASKIGRADFTHTHKFMQHLQIEGWNGHQDSILASQCLIYWFSIYAKAENMFHVFWPALCKIKAPRLCASVLVDCAASTMDGLFKLHMLCQDENSKTKKPHCLLILLSLFCVSQNTQQCFITILFRTCSLDLLWIRGSKPYNSDFCAPSSRKAQQKIDKTITLVFLPPTTF